MSSEIRVEFRDFQIVNKECKPLRIILAVIVIVIRILSIS